MDTNQILDAVKAKLGLKTDYKLSKYLNHISTGRISGWRAGKSRPDDETCFIFAEILEIEAGAIIAATKLNNPKEENREFWNKQAKKYAAAFGIIATLSGSVAEANNHPSKCLLITGSAVRVRLGEP